MILEKKYKCTITRSSSKAYKMPLANARKDTSLSLGYFIRRLFLERKWLVCPSHPLKQFPRLGQHVRLSLGKRYYPGIRSGSDFNSFGGSLIQQSPNPREEQIHKRV